MGKRRFWLVGAIALAGCNFDNEDLWGKLTGNFDFKQQVWTRLDVGAEDNLNAIVMVDPNSGYAAGEKGLVLTTTDGGATWQPSYPAVMSGKAIVSLAFSSPVQGLAASSEELFGTQDGGRSWQLVSKFPAGSGIRRLRFANAGAGYAVGAKTHLTLDGGKTWTATTPGSVSELAIAGGNVFAGGAGVYRGLLGEAWTGVLGADRLCNACLAFPAFASENEGWAAVVRPGREHDDPFKLLVFHTTDAGASWVTLKTQDYQGNSLDKYLAEGGFDTIRALRFADARNGWMLFGGGLLSTSDGGQTWIAQNQSFATGKWTTYRMEQLSSVGFADLSVLDTTHAWTVAGKNVYRYDGALYPPFHQPR